jgi:uncharacterized membrane protein
MFASRRSSFFGRRRRTATGIGTAASLAAASAMAAAAAVYFFDPDAGRRRRSLVRDQAVSVGRRSREFAGEVGRDAQQRVSGIRRRSHAESEGRNEFEYLQENWAPAPRVLAGAAALALLIGGLSRGRSPLGLGLATLGAGLLGRSISNTPWSQLVGIGADVSDGVLVQQTINVYADVDEAYACWRKLEDFPKFMSHVREVTKRDETHYHWKVDGPAGIPVEWDAVITADVPRELIAWRTVDGSAVQSAGVVQFEPSSYGGARVHVRLTYRPPANLVGHTVAKIFGKDPQHQIEGDLARFKTFVETGRPPRDNAASAETRH